MNFLRAAVVMLVLGAVAPGVAAAAAAPAQPAHAADFDTTCAPCHDFDQFANGGWMAHTMMPAGYSNYGAFDELYDRNEAVLRKILEETAADKSVKPGTDKARLADYYSSCMDSAGAEAAGGKPIAGLLADVDALTSTQDVARQVAWMHANGVPALFGFFAAQDPKNSESVIAFVGQGGLGLPDRDYYTRTDSATIATRAIYVRTTANLLKLTGESADLAAKHADAVHGTGDGAGAGVDDQRPAPRSQGDLSQDAVGLAADPVPRVRVGRLRDAAQRWPAGRGQRHAAGFF